MFISAKISNFRKLRSLFVEFGPGMIAIRAANESGKSTLLEAIAYAMTGAEALREPLADVVTWGEKETSLKVELKLKINGHVIDIRRGKSGAEIDVDGKLSATGQKEVTRFVEGLLGAAPKMAGKLMMASQGALRGALEDGPTATAQLIEGLSNFGLIDEIIALVQEHLPSGSPVAVEQQLKALAGQLETERPGELDLSALQAEVRDCTAALNAEQAELAAVAAELPPATAAAEQARRNAAALASAQREVSTAQATLARANGTLAGLQPVPAVSAEELARLRVAAAAAAEAGAAAAAHRELAALARPAQEWEGTRQSFDEAATAGRLELDRQVLHANQLGLRKAEVTGRLIKETSCAFCGKDLRDVPEVALHNSPLAAEVAAIEREQALTLAVIQELQADQEAYASIAAADRAAARVYAKHARYVSLQDTAVPPLWTWAGPDLSQAVMAGAGEALAAAEAEVRRADKDAGQKAALEAEIGRASAALGTAQAWVADLEPKVAADRSVGLETDLKAKARYHEERAARQRAEILRLEAAMATAQQVHAVKVSGYSRIQDAYKAAEIQLEELQLNNVLLRKLRGARPKVADKLWGVILATVGHYFSGIRGVQSVVSKEDSGFKVDGKPVTGLSGSALDSLGLGIRIALTKTFLPNIDFLMLDEPGAACDDNRESSMLGVLSTAGFQQVLLVTHSAMADVFADQVVTL